MFSFFIHSDNILDDKILLTDEITHHLEVIRIQSNEKILFIDENQIEYLCEFNNFNSIKILEKKQNTNESNIKISLFQSIPKSDKFEFIIQKSVELGVFDIYPVNSQYCISKIKNDKKFDRFNKISESAAKQSKRGIIPKIHNDISFNDAINIAKNYDLILICYENENSNLKNELKKLLSNKIKNIAVFIGPEGGYSNNEILLFKQNEFKIISLGKRILRTETASLNILSILTYEFDGGFNDLS